MVVAVAAAIVAIFLKYPATKPVNSLKNRSTLFISRLVITLRIILISIIITLIILISSLIITFARLKIRIILKIKLIVKK